MRSTAEHDAVGSSAAAAAFRGATAKGGAWLRDEHDAATQRLRTTPDAASEHVAPATKHRPKLQLCK